MIILHRVLLGVAVAAVLAMVFVSRTSVAPRQQPAEPVQVNVSASVMNARHEMPEEFLVRGHGSGNTAGLSMDIAPVSEPAQPIGTISGGTCAPRGVELKTYTMQVGSHTFRAVEVPNVFTDGRYIEIREEGTIDAECRLVGGTFIGSIQYRYSTRTYTFTDVRDNKVAVSERDGTGTLRISDWTRNQTFDPIYTIAQIHRRNTDSGQDIWVIKQRYTVANWLSAIPLAITAAESYRRDGAPAPSVNAWHP